MADGLDKIIVSIGAITSHCCFASSSVVPPSMYIKPQNSPPQTFVCHSISKSWYTPQSVHWVYDLCGVWRWLLVFVMMSFHTVNPSSPLKLWILPFQSWLRSQAVCRASHWSLGNACRGHFGGYTHLQLSHSSPLTCEGQWDSSVSKKKWLIILMWWN